MAHELNMSVNQYYGIKDKLIPKHLMVNDSQRKRIAIFKSIFDNSPHTSIQQNKIQKLTPVYEIQTIMKHFDAKFKNKKIINPQKTPAKRQTRHRHQNSEMEYEKKMKQYLQLPIIKNIKKEAQKYRHYLNADEIKRKDDIKSKILQNFSNYMEAQLKGNPNVELRARLKTIN